MASVYILYSKTSDIYYIGYSKDLQLRLEYHHFKEFPISFTSKYSDWELFFSIDHISAGTAVKIERHIKKMKSRVYIENLKRYPAIAEKLLEKYN